MARLDVARLLAHILRPKKKPARIVDPDEPEKDSPECATGRTVTGGDCGIDSASKASHDRVHSSVPARSTEYVEHGDDLDAEKEPCEKSTTSSLSSQGSNSDDAESDEPVPKRSRLHFVLSQCVYLPPLPFPLRYPHQGPIRMILPRPPPPLNVNPTEVLRRALAEERRQRKRGRRRPQRRPHAHIVAPVVVQEPVQAPVQPPAPPIYPEWPESEDIDTSDDDEGRTGSDHVDDSTINRKYWACSDNSSDAMF